jgi:hypothetical protein
MNGTMITEWWIGRDVEGSGFGIISDTIAAVVWKDYWKLGNAVAYLVAALCYKVEGREFESR